MEEASTSVTALKGFGNSRKYVMMLRTLIRMLIIEK
jgi:hypothetical protein